MILYQQGKIFQGLIIVTAIITVPTIVNHLYTDHYINDFWSEKFLKVPLLNLHFMGSVIFMFELTIYKRKYVLIRVYVTEISGIPLFRYQVLQLTVFVN